MQTTRPDPRPLAVDLVEAWAEAVDQELVPADAPLGRRRSSVAAAPGLLDDSFGLGGWRSGGGR
jgi:hypothetical protein